MFFSPLDGYIWLYFPSGTAFLFGSTVFDWVSFAFLATGLLNESNLLIDLLGLTSVDQVFFAFY